MAEGGADSGVATVLGISLSAAMQGWSAWTRSCAPRRRWSPGLMRGLLTRRADGHGERLYRSTGAPVHPMTPLTKLIWFGRHEPTLFRATRWWVGLKGHLLWHLSGTLVTELSSASGTRMLEMATRTWSQEAMDVAGPRGRLRPQLTGVLTAAAHSDAARER